MSTFTRRVTFGVVSALALGSIALWPVPRGALEPLAIEARAVQQEVSQPSAAASAGSTMPRAAAAQQVPTAAAQPLALAAHDGDEPQHPHPLTPEREGLQHEIRLIGALQDALDLQDVPTLRSLIARYRAHVPGDENKLAEGFARLADCLEIDEHDPSTVRAAAAAYYQNERASTLRRYIRRICLER